MLKVSNLSKSIQNQTLFEEASFIINEQEKVGLIGSNGAGKSTLMKMIAGLDQDYTGKINSPGESIGYLPQKISFPTGSTIDEYLKSALTEEWEEYKIDMVLEDLGIRNFKRDRIAETLSGGEQARIGLAKLMLDEPTALLLDEPTNNLDIEGLEWLENFVKHFPGLILVISHDRAFLDNTVDRILEIDPLTHQLTNFVGGYTEYTQQKKLLLEKQLEEYRRQENKRKWMEEWIALKQQQAKIYDDPRAGKMIKAMKKRYQREIVDNGVSNPKSKKKLGLSEFGSATHAQKMVFSVTNFNFHNFLSCESLTITGLDRIHLSGPNGSGKSTFIKALLGKNVDFEGEIKTGPELEIAYFAQMHDSLNLDESAIDNFNLHVTGSESELRKKLGAFLLTGDKVFQPVKTFSEGEKIRLIMAILTSKDNQFLVLDEPTNHLDIDSREVLDQALLDFAGGFIVVSHDRYFVEKINVNRQLTIEFGEIRESWD